MTVDASQQLARWRRIRASLSAGRPIDQADATWLARAAAAVIEEGLPARVAYGLAPRGGPGGLHRVAQIERRDAVLRTIYHAHFSHLSPRAAAREVLALTNRRQRSGEPVNSAVALAIAELRTLGELPALRRLTDILGNPYPPLDFHAGMISTAP